MLVLVACPERHEPRWIERSSGKLGLTIAGNGAYQIRPWCDDCDRWASGAVPLERVRNEGIAPTDLQVINDFRGNLGRCSVRGCDREAVEDHHFAPRAVFDLTADDWPRGLLCVDHHVEWHNRMRVPA